MSVRLVRGKSLREVKADLRRLPLSVSHAIARQVAPMLTEFSRKAFDSGRNVYGDKRPAGAGGRELTLVNSGDTRRALSFKVSGTIIRAELGPRYARFLVGKYKILPVGDRSALPVNWARAIDEIARVAVENPRLLAA